MFTVFEMAVPALRYATTYGVVAPLFVSSRAFKEIRMRSFGLMATNYIKLI